MIALVIKLPRIRIPEFYEFLDTHDPLWRFYNVYDNSKADDARQARVREVNLQFVQIAILAGTGDFSSQTTVIVSPKCAMAIRLSWEVDTLIDLRSRAEQDASVEIV